MKTVQTRTTGRGRRIWVKTLLIGGTALLLICAGLAAGASYLVDRLTEPGDPVLGANEVTVKDFEFSPDSIEIAPGTTVTWTWSGKEDHDVHGDGLSSPVQKSGTYRYTFEEPGEYDYECTLHSIMRGRVIVSDEIIAKTATPE